MYPCTSPHITARFEILHIISPVAVGENPFFRLPILPLLKGTYLWLKSSCEVFAGGSLYFPEIPSFHQILIHYTDRLHVIFI